MTEIFVMTRDHEFWEKAAALAEHCSWRAGSHLAQKMRDNDFAEWERVHGGGRWRCRGILHAHRKGRPSRAVRHKPCALPA